MQRLTPGTRLFPNHAGYGKGPGHFEVVQEPFRGPITMAVGVAVCCVTCCPCGFCFALDSKSTHIWVVDPDPGLMPPPNQMGMAYGGFAAAPQPGAGNQQRLPAQQALQAQPMQVLNVRCGTQDCGRILKVQPQGSGVLQFQCPYCHLMNQITYMPQPAGPAEEVITTPSWFKPNALPVTDPDWSPISPVPQGTPEYDLIVKLVNGTFKAGVTTRDREFRKPPERLEVVSVLANCNMRAWTNYARRRNAILRGMSGNFYTSKTSEVLAGAGNAASVLGPLEVNANEFLLFHGSKPGACENICRSDFMTKLAGSNAGSLYGPGIYFGENSTKSDEYATDDRGGLYAGLYAMLLCRVTCGRVLYNDQVSPNAEELTRLCSKGGSFDSVLGDREKARGTFREFVVFNNDQVYPQYAILYKRVESNQG